MTRRLPAVRPLLTAALLLPIVAAPAAADHADSSATVIVQANSFQPARVDVAPGGTVTWHMLQGGHTIAADDGRFDFRSSTGGTLDEGERRSFTVSDLEEVIGYRCTIHSGMRGAIVVGHPPPVVHPAPTVRVPEDFATIGQAVAAAPDWGRVEIAAGTYPIDEPVVASRTGVTITGTGEDPIDVAVVAGSRTPSSAFVVSGSHMTITNLSVQRMGRFGIHVTRADAATVADVVVDGEQITMDGVRIEDTTGATVRDSVVRRARRAAVRIEPCVACGVRIVSSELSESLAGVVATGARGVQVVDSTIRDNAVGVVARSGDRRPTAIAVRGNRVVDNTARDSLPDLGSDDRLLAGGAGIWFSGVAESSVTDNTIAGHDGYGIAVSGGAVTTAVTGNDLAGNADADLAWDGVGADVCFTGNGDAATSHPARIEDLYPCDRPTVGLPYPFVNLHLLLHVLEEPTP